jgi:hypothetical protein
VVALRDRASGCFLADGATWSSRVERALVLDRDEARELVRRFACEPDAIELVAARLAVDAA